MVDLIVFTFYLERKHTKKAHLTYGTVVRDCVVLLCTPFLFHYIQLMSWLIYHAFKTCADELPPIAQARETMCSSYRSLYLVPETYMQLM